MSTDKVVKQLREFFRTQAGADLTGLSDVEPLFTSGIMDSFSFIELLAYIETDLGVRVELVEINIDDLDTIEAIASYVARRSVTA